MVVVPVVQARKWVYREPRWVSDSHAIGPNRISSSITIVDAVAVVVEVEDGGCFCWNSFDDMRETWLWSLRAWEAMDDRWDHAGR